MSADDTYIHNTSKDNLMKILNSGRIKSLRHIAKDTPDTEVNVEPDLLSRSRTTMAASEAYDKMKDTKAADRVFLTRGGYEPSYGKHMIMKTLKSPKAHDWINLIPNEHTTRRALSTKSNATVVVPEVDVPEFTQAFPGIKVQSLETSGLQELGMADKAYTLAKKLVNRNFGLSKASSAEAIGNPHELSEAKVRKLFGNNAFVFGSQALGIADQASDVDIVVPYKRDQSFEQAKQRMLDKYKGVLKPSINSAEKHKFTGMVNGVDLDVTLTRGERAQRFKTAFEAAKHKLTPEEKQKIIDTKRRLRKAWILPEWRYNRYKRQLATDLGLKQHYF